MTGRGAADGASRAGWDSAAGTPGAALLPLLPAVRSAALVLARRLGLPAQEAAPLHAGSNAVLHLAPTPVVARVARLTALARPRPGDALAREVDLATWLAGRGAAVLPPTALVPPGPHTEAGLVMTLWPLLERAVPVTGDPVAVAASLAALHERASGYRRPLPGLREVVADATRAMAVGARWLPDGVVASLREEAAWAADAAAAVDAEGSTGAGAWPRQALHGDAHPRNLLRLAGTGARSGAGSGAGAGGALWCDLEDAVHGPVEWDLAVLAGSVHHDGAGALAAHAAVTGRTPDVGLLDELRRLRRWQGRCWAVLAAAAEPTRRPAVLATLPSTL